MDVETIVQIISSVGFPIVASVGLFWFIVKVQEQNRVMMDKLSDSISTNTIAINALKDKLDDNGKHTA